MLGLYGPAAGCIEKADGVKEGESIMDQFHQDGQDGGTSGINVVERAQGTGYASRGSVQRQLVRGATGLSTVAP